jgi:hypothetical protein
MLLSRCRQTSIGNLGKLLLFELYDEVSISANAHMTGDCHAIPAQNLPKYTAICPILLGNLGSLDVLKGCVLGNKNPAKSLN